MLHNLSPQNGVPIALGQLGKLLLQDPGDTTLNPFHQPAYRCPVRVVNMNMSMILANHSLQDPEFFYLTHLVDQLPATLLNISFQYLIAILRDPAYLTRQPAYRLDSLHIFLSTAPIQIPL